MARAKKVAERWNGSSGDMVAAATAQAANSNLPAPDILENQLRQMSEPPAVSADPDRVTAGSDTESASVSGILSAPVSALGSGSRPRESISASRGSAVPSHGIAIPRGEPGSAHNDHELTERVERGESWIEEFFRLLT